MQIAVISDTHNDIFHLEKAIQEIQRREISHLVHCGDVTLSQTLRPCKGLRLFLAYGNGDSDERAIAEELSLLNPENRSGLTLDFFIERQRFYVAHGDSPKLIQSALTSGLYDWVLQGHTHRFKNEIIGKSHWVNPGALGGKLTETGSFVVLDTVKMSVERVFTEER